MSNSSYYQKNRVKLIKKQKKYYKKNRNKHIQARKTPAYKLAKRDHWLWNTYGIDSATVDIALKINNYKCQICPRKLNRRTRHLMPNVDHCHKTGRVRGIICGHCNTMLGKAKDSLQVLENAIKYLNNEL